MVGHYDTIKEFLDCGVSADEIVTNFSKSGRSKRVSRKARVINVGYNTDGRTRAYHHVTAKKIQIKSIDNINFLYVLKQIYTVYFS